MDKKRFANILIPSICAAAVIIPPAAIAISEMEPIQPEPIITQIYDVRISPGAKTELDKRKVQEKTRYETTIEATGDKQIIGLNSIKIEDRDEPLVEGQDYTFNLDTSKLVIYENVVDGDVTINVAFDKVDVKIISAWEIDCDKKTLNYHKKDVLILRTDVEVTSISNILIYVGEERVTTGFSWIFVTEQNSTAIYISFSDPNIVIDTITIYIPLPGQTELVIDAPEDVSFSQTLITPGRYFWTTIYSSQPLSEEIYVYVNGNRISGGLIDFYCDNSWYGVHYQNNLEINGSAFKEGDIVTVKLFAESKEKTKVNVESSQGLDNYFDLNKVAFPNVEYDDTLVLRKDAPADLNIDTLYLYLTNKRGEKYNINFSYWDYYLDEKGFYTIFGGNFWVPGEFIDEEITIHIEQYDKHKVILSDECKQYMSISEEYVYDGPAAKSFDIKSEIGFGTIKVTDDDGTEFTQDIDFNFSATWNDEFGYFCMDPDVKVTGALHIGFENLPTEHDTIIPDQSGRYKFDCSYVAKQWNQWTVTATVLDSAYKFYGKPKISFTIGGRLEHSYQIESWDEDHVTFTLRNDWGSSGIVRVLIDPPQAATWTINTDGCYFLMSDGTKTKSFNFYTQGRTCYFNLYFEKPTDIDANEWATVTDGIHTRKTDGTYGFGWTDRNRTDSVVEMFMDTSSSSPQFWTSCKFDFKMRESTQLNVTVGDNGEYSDQMIYRNSTSLNRELKEVVYFKPDALINSEDIIFNDVKVTIGGTTYTSDQINVMTGYDDRERLNYLYIYGKTPIQVTGAVSIDMPVLPATELVATQEGVTFSKPRAYKSSESDLITFVNSNEPLSNQIEIEVNGQTLTTDQYVYVPDWSDQYHSAYLMIDKNALKPDNVKKAMITTHTLPSVSVELTNHTDLFKLSHQKILKGSVNYFEILWNSSDWHSEFSRTIKGIHLFSTSGEILTGWSYKIARSRTQDIGQECINISIDDPTICDHDLSITIDYEEFHK